MSHWIKELITGFFIGVANIIPGVSGGTFLLIFGIYEKTVSSINRINKNTVMSFFRHLFELLTKFGKKSFRRFLCFFIDNNFSFLLRLAAGAGIAIISLSHLMKFLLTQQFSNTYAFFFGLISVSVFIPLKLIRKIKPHHLLIFFAGLAVTIFLAASVNPAEKAIRKTTIYKESYLSNNYSANNPENGNSHSRKAFSYSGAYSVKEYLLVFGAGALAVSAMVLPGISGSLVLIMTGQYFAVITSISRLSSFFLEDLIFLCLFSLGMAIGLIVFSRIVTRVFKKYHDGTMSFLTGLMAGSLYTLWPFKQTITIDRYIKENGMIHKVTDAVLYTNSNKIPNDIQDIAAALICALAGIIIMYLFIQNKKKIKTDTD